MVGKDKLTSHASHHMNPIPFLLIGLIITIGTLSVFTLVLNQSHTAVAQQPQLSSLGDSSRPLTGYDGKTTAEDIHQLVSQWDSNKSFWSDMM